MPLIQVVLVLIVVGVLLWLIDRFVPMAGSIKSILNAVVVIAVDFVAAERFWSFEFAVCNPRRQIGDKDAAFLETPKILSTAANTRECSGRFMYALNNPGDRREVFDKSCALRHSKGRNRGTDPETFLYKFVQGGYPLSPT
jgi:hypothetical protein